MISRLGKVLISLAAGVAVFVTASVGAQDLERRHAEALLGADMLLLDNGEEALIQGWPEKGVEIVAQARHRLDERRTSVVFEYQVATDLIRESMLQHFERAGWQYLGKGETGADRRADGFCSATGTKLELWLPSPGLEGVGLATTRHGGLRCTPDIVPELTRGANLARETVEQLGSPGDCAPGGSGSGSGGVYFQWSYRLPCETSTLAQVVNYYRGRAAELQWRQVGELPSAVNHTSSWELTDSDQVLWHATLIVSAVSPEGDTPTSGNHFSVMLRLDRVGPPGGG